MKKNKSSAILYLAIAILIIITTPLDLHSQGGSNYSIFGIGDIVYSQSASAQAMGGCQIAVPSQTSINMLNPAMWALVKTTRVQTGYRFNQNMIQNKENNLWQNNGLINGFSSIFNFDTSREISAALLLQPLSTVNYYIASPVTIEENGMSFEGKKSYRGTGGLSNLTLGVGAKIMNNVYLGLSVAGLVGKIEHSNIINLTLNQSIDYRINNSNVFSGLDLAIGLFAEPIKNLGIGAFYKHQTKADLETRQEYIYLSSVGGYLKDTALIEKTNIGMPDFLGIGLSYTAGKLMFAADYLYGTFSKLELKKKIAQNENFRDMQKFSIGITKLGNPNQFATLADKTSYKLGAYYEQLYYKVNSTPINEYAITGGCQFPISRTAQVDFSLVFGTRGTTNDGLVRENFGRMIIEISIGDNWFKPIKPDY